MNEAEIQVIMARTVERLDGVLARLDKVDNKLDHVSDKMEKINVRLINVTDKEECIKTNTNFDRRLTAIENTKNAFPKNVQGWLTLVMTVIMLASLLVAAVGFAATKKGIISNELLSEEIIQQTIETGDE